MATVVHAADVAYAESDYLELTVNGARRQWLDIVARRPLPPGARQVAFVPVETLLCLAGMYVVDHSRFGSGSANRAPEPVQQLARLFRRPPTSILAKMANLDGTRSHGAKNDLVAGARLRSDPSRMAHAYRTVLAAARSAGVGPDVLPDFLGVEHGGAIELLGQDELGGSAVESALESELQAWLRKSDLPEVTTERLMWASVRVGQHRFATSVLANCGRECVFCGFTLTDSGPSLLRASHIKPWRNSDHRERLDIANGLAACPTHDSAFDVGLITVDEDLAVRRSRRLENAMVHNQAVRRAFEPGMLRASIAAPRRAVAPGRPFIDWHREHVFTP
ncbi:HNH endonuclease [Cellulomonas soli]|uniref:Endonuclease n=1 Tax=Cellulomonas soli TaxID=931535 RepID=A0A512PI56_9CELL|nr:HNH endonuclease [Cellulomonas soli]NYI58736.1 putative restriction endonuclease [Cellulomonas soli]GEP70884.1 endonuclease [Cellulomonas soli]